MTDDAYDDRKRELTYTLQRPLQAEQRKVISRVVAAADFLVSCMVVQAAPIAADPLASIILFPCEALAGQVLGVLEFWVARPQLTAGAPIPGVDGLVVGCVLPLLPALWTVASVQPAVWQITLGLAAADPERMLEPLLPMVSVDGRDVPEYHQTLGALCGTPRGVFEIWEQPGAANAAQPVEDAPFAVVKPRIWWLLRSLEEGPARVRAALPHFALELAQFWQEGEAAVGTDSARYLRGVVGALGRAAREEEAAAILEGCGDVVELVAQIMLRA